MNAHETTEIRELTTAELELVAGGGKTEQGMFVAVLLVGGWLAFAPCVAAANVGVLKAL